MVVVVIVIVIVIVFVIIIVISPLLKSITLMLGQIQWLDLDNKNVDRKVWKMNEVSRLSLVIEEILWLRSAIKL